MAEPNVSMLKLALRKITSDSSEEKEEEGKEENPDADLEQAMSDFQNATSTKEKVAAFKAALELAK